MAAALERFLSPGKGNGLRATGGIRAGELLSSAEPLASCVSSRRSRDVCNRCYTRRETLLRCSQCKTARYCNITCQKQAWSDHKRECKCLRSLLPRVPTDSVRLAARLIFALLSPSKGSSEELYTLEEHESHLSSMSEQKKQGLSQLASMLELYLQQEAPDLAKEITSALPPSCREPLSLIAKENHQETEKHSCHRSKIICLIQYRPNKVFSVCIVCIVCTHQVILCNDFRCCF
nr:PREDICTED: histone-lysine N-methyltransferase SMYD3-like [Paralichthys olivaceus]